MNIVIFGATGPTGQHLISQALEAGHTVTAFVRSPEKLSAEIKGRVNVIVGDVLKNIECVEHAVQGQDVVLSALGSNVRKGGDLVNSQGARNIIDAMRKFGVTRFVAVSTIGIADTVQRMSKLTHFVLRMVIGDERLQDAEMQEDVVSASELDWTLVRPPRLVDGDAKATVTAERELFTKFSAELRRANLATFMLSEAVNNNFVRTPVTVIN